MDHFGFMILDWNVLQSELHWVSLRATSKTFP